MDQVASWLTAIKLPQYVDAFSSNGYDDPSVIPALDDNDLQHLGVTLPGHRKRILLHGLSHRNCFSVFEAMFYILGVDV